MHLRPRHPASQIPPDRAQPFQPLVMITTLVLCIICISPPTQNDTCPVGQAVTHVQSTLIMAPVELPEKHLDLVPLLLTAGVTLAASASLLSIGRSFFKLRKALPVSSRTRSHETQRRRNVIVFVVLAAISLAINLYNTIELFVDSYTHFIVANRVIPETDIWTSPIWSVHLQRPTNI